MVDCDYFTDFNKDLTIEDNRIILEFKKSNYNLELYQSYHSGPSPSTDAKKLNEQTTTIVSKKYHFINRRKFKSKLSMVLSRWK